MDDQEKSPWPVGQLAISLAMLALSATMLIVGQYGYALVTVLAGAAGWVITRLIQQSPAQQDRAAEEAAKRAVDEVLAAHERGGKEAVRELCGTVVRREADGSVIVSQKPPPLKLRLGLPAAGLLAAAGFLAWTRHDFLGNWIPTAIIEGFILACTMLLTVCAWHRQYYRASVDQLVIVTTWPLLPHFRRSVAWAEVVELRDKNASGEPIPLDVLMVTAKGKPLLLERTLLEAACEEVASEGSRAVLAQLNALGRRLPAQDGARDPKPKANEKH
ncbi:MAG TPA: hypothetical protein PK280_09605 [Planctomycetota bacterium]|nr:hypothetical protein [Planctomycetota bacterium]